ncbi:MAG: hypothetical protein M0002_13965 [Rhodospirillales bacterium]|nr:hypothetical protein [Rhodospirillales bacterium]
MPARRGVHVGLAVLGVAGLVAGCAGPPETAQQRAAYAACRREAEQQFAIQDRASLYQPDNSLTPYAGGSPALATTTTLANRFAYRQMLDACLRGATGPAPVAPAPAPQR